MSLNRKMQTFRGRVMPPSVRPKVMAAHAKIRRADWRRALRAKAGRHPW